MANFFETLRTNLAGEVSKDAADLKEVSGDFGRIVDRTPSIVVRPASTKDVATVVRLAHEQGVSVTSRGAAHSQNAQGLSEDGILLDMTSLTGAIEVDENNLTATCLAGTSWNDLVATTMEQGLVPLVLTNNLDVTVGGTLSVAGTGVATFKYSAQVDICERLEVVTGNGEIVECDREQNRDLFDSARAGLGLFGVITRATVRLRRFQPSVRTFFLLYDNLETLMRDERTLIERDEIDYIESWCVPCPMGFRQGPMGNQMFAEWFYPLHVSIEFENAEPVADRVLDGLTPYRRSHVADRPLDAFVRRLVPLFELWKRAGYWAATHPWMEVVLPWNTAPQYISQVLGNLPPPALGGGHVLLWPSRGRTSDAPLFRTPDSDFVMGFGILPGVPKDLLPQAAPRLAMVSDLSTMMGGKRYVSGYLNFDLARWQAHFGERWPWMIEMKRKFDPYAMLNPGLIPFDWVQTAPVGEVG